MSRALGRSDVRAGLVFVLCGALALGLGPAEKGTATDMAAGYLPALLGVLLIAVGLILAALGVRAVRLDQPPGSERAVRSDGARGSEAGVHPNGAADSRQAAPLERAPASQDASHGAASFSRLRPFFILPAIVAFALLLESVGLVLASIALLGIGALAARDMTLRQFALLAIVLLVLVLAVFVWGLGLPVKVWPAFGAAA
jgi:hypothetical protein